MTKKKNIYPYPIQKMGKYCGYEEYEDGSIGIAPSHSDKIDKISAQEIAVEFVIKSVISHCINLLESINKDTHGFWVRLSEDYGLDLSNYIYTYHAPTKHITRKPIKDEP